MFEQDRLVWRKEFSVCIKRDTFDVFTGGECFFTLPVRSALPLEDQPDVDDESLIVREIRETSEDVTAIWTTRSSLWERKEYRLHVGEKNFFYCVRVWGQGRPKKISYFSGNALGKHPGAAYETSGYLLPQPRIGVENHCFTMAEDNEIAMQLMVPPSFCFPFRMEDCSAWFGLGLAGVNGDYNFDTFRYQNQSGRFVLSVNLYSRTKVDGEWKAPGILGCPGGDEWDVLRRYGEWHYQNGCNPRPVGIAGWWKGPYFCGWGEQAALSGKYQKSIYDMASQKAYTEMSEHLDVLGLNPSAIIIDDKWQRTYGEALPDIEKWPDLRSFVETEHRKGRRVVLWFKCWSSEGLPSNECVTLWGQPVGADPTNPHYIRRMRETIRILFSDEEGCYNCDGFKIDFADCMPRGVEMQTFEPGVCGVELLKRLLLLIYQSAKAVKPDALINCSVCHPYLAEVTDQVRLHDYDYRLRSVKSCMKFRKCLYDTMLPGVSIDTDFPAFAGYKDAMAYLRYAPSLGVPDLYRLSDTDECVFTEEDWTEVRHIWENYCAGFSN